MNGSLFDDYLPGGTKECKEVDKPLDGDHLGVVIMGMEEGIEPHHRPFLDQP